MSDPIRKANATDVGLAYLRRHLGEWVSQIRLIDVSEANDIMRALRKARQDGYPIEFSGKAEARLLAEPMKDQRGDGLAISGAQRKRILERDGSICRRCGRGVGDVAFDGSPVRLEIHHLIHRDDGGPTIDENLETRCHVCHKDEHAQPRGSEW